MVLDTDVGKVASNICIFPACRHVSSTLLSTAPFMPRNVGNNTAFSWLPHFDVPQLPRSSPKDSKHLLFSPIGVVSEIGNERLSAV